MCNTSLNFLLDLKRLIVSENELYNNNKSNIEFLSGICGLIVFKVASYKRLLKIYIDINDNKPIPHQPLLILFLITDFFIHKKITQSILHKEYVTS